MFFFPLVFVFVSECKVKVFDFGLFMIQVQWNSDSIDHEARSFPCVLYEKNGLFTFQCRPENFTRGKNRIGCKKIQNEKNKNISLKNSLSHNSFANRNFFRWGVCFFDLMCLNQKCIESESKNVCWTAVDLFCNQAFQAISCTVYTGYAGCLVLMITRTHIAQLSEAQHITSKWNYWI